MPSKKQLIIGGSIALVVIAGIIVAAVLLTRPTGEAAVVANKHGGCALEFEYMCIPKGDYACIPSDATTASGTNPALVSLTAENIAAISDQASKTGIAITYNQAGGGALGRDAVPGDGFAIVSEEVLPDSAITAIIDSIEPDVAANTVAQYMRYDGVTESPAITGTIMVVVDVHSAGTFPPGYELSGDLVYQNDTAVPSSILVSTIVPKALVPEDFTGCSP